jgi:hypothetical protein
MRQIYPHSQSHRSGFSRVGAGRGLWPWPRWCAAHSSTPCRWSVMRFVVGDRDPPAIAGGDPVGHPGVVGVMPLSRRLRLADPSAFGTHRCLRSTVEGDIETPIVPSLRKGGALARHRSVPAASSSELPTSVGLASRRRGSGSAGSARGLGDFETPPTPRSTGSPRDSDGCRRVVRHPHKGSPMSPPATGRSPPTGCNSKC